MAIAETHICAHLLMAIMIFIKSLLNPMSQRKLNMAMQVSFYAQYLKAYS